MRLTNASGGVIVLPDGQEVAPGADVDVTAETAKASGVASLVASGGLVEADTKPKK